MTMRVSTLLFVVFIGSGGSSSVTAFSPVSSTSVRASSSSSLFASKPPTPTRTHVDADDHAVGIAPHATSLTVVSRAICGAALSLAIVTLPFLIGGSSPANADEWGKETEAPTLFTGETVMICKKRGPLGACLETTLRTSENDNDKALSYFKDPAPALKLRRQQDIDTLNQESEGNELIQKLRRQSLDNKEKNDLAVLQKTLMNDRGASFGPFDRQVVILNTDGVTFTLLQNPQAMRLKDAGYIDDQRRFIIQPSKEVIEDALVAKEGSGEGLGGALKGFFGGGGSSGGGSDGTAPVVNDGSVEVATPSSTPDVEVDGSKIDSQAVEE
ncbi:hypothetical protein ACHAWU_008295 [Discostella pseudostelligera]|uniref:Uncharacterized protein n=1 Tax=Discostella pseudostelligera TaxID=259834 RepID=A0ABD3M994_9STRA